MSARAADARRAAVLGSPIAHSLSPVLHRAAYTELGLTDWTYDRFEVDEGGLPGFMGELGPEWAGLSLTMPLKRPVLQLLDSVSQRVKLKSGSGGGFRRRLCLLISEGLHAGLPATSVIASTMLE
jgi:shikimate 5-dehydrogenase